MATRAHYFQINAQEEQSMLNACSSGDIRALEQLLKKHGVQGGNNTGNLPFDQTATADGPAKLNTISLSIHTLLEKAVAARQLAVVKLILQTCPAILLTHGHGVVHTVLEAPDSDILQELCAHDHTFASFSVDHGMRSFLTDACALPPAQAVPILHILLDNNADVNDGCGPGGGALYAAIRGGQPVEIVSRILSKTKTVSGSHGILGIRRGDADIVRELFSSEATNRKLRVEECIEEAKKTEDEEIIKVV
ncbi:hypothetical protein F5B22DRAFT_630190 [Xylaria bambusicola]|uniref:uncharacterized protein n=1 Tax=Xylaria bambusicola TaxID=326684 RepID=UPI002007A70C|nr:uncharacterized protein F5B22DRAFT_630190 [Xylaria bambusicola]KAI0503233.1 hypothetical protein F5B22DRAFT_630190 [Xylaria bambusicola]